MYSPNKIIRTISLIGACTLALAPVAWAQGNPSANGGGTTIEGGEKSTFVFNAVEHPNGNVTGHLVYHHRTTDFGWMMDIDCLTIHRNEAVLSGVVTKLIGEVPPEFYYIFVGAPGTFAVMDNGEGPGDPADLISDVYFGFGDCNVFRPVLYLPVSGNIQVRQ